MKTRNPIRSLALGLVAFLGLVGCSNPLRIQIISASISPETTASNNQVSVQLSRDDAMALAEHEIYSQIVVFECGNGMLRYPASPRLGNIPMDDFGGLRNVLRASGRDSHIDIQADVIRSFLNRLTRICVRMEGGSYLGRSLSSNVVEIAPASTADLVR